MSKLPEPAKFIFLNTTKRSHFFATVIVLLQRMKITQIVTATLGNREEVINFSIRSQSSCSRDHHVIGS
jgi:hypothetical protein